MRDFIVCWTTQQHFKISVLLSEGRGKSGCSATRKDRKCLPGLTCDEDFYCILDRGESLSLFELHSLFSLFFSSLPSLEASCLHTMHLGEEIAWKPSCEVDGSYAAKQCRGDKLTGRFQIFNNIFLLLWITCHFIDLHFSLSCSLLCHASDASATRRRATRSSAGSGGKTLITWRASAADSAIEPNVLADWTWHCIVFLTGTLKHYNATWEYAGAPTSRADSSSRALSLCRIIFGHFCHVVSFN